MSTQNTTQVVIERTFAAPRELVYRAFTEADQLSAWFGPVGWSVPRESVDVDVRAGGHQRFTMVNDSDPSQTSPVDATFVEVVENELLVGQESFTMPGDSEPTLMTMRIELSDAEDGGTLLTITQGPFSDEMAEMTREGWGSSFTKLDALLAD